MRRLALSFLCLYFAVGVRSADAQAPQVTTAAIRSDRAEKIRIPGVPTV
jgi:hypothetical protein